MSESPFAPGTILAGKYRIERVLGEGGHGVVVAAYHLALGERVAIKILRAEVAADEETVARFLREARASVRIKGEHVTRVLDVGSMADGLPFMVMEHLDGNDLANVLATSGWLPVSVAVDYVLQACEALAEAHALGIVHRDIKPSNLFLTTRTDGSPCIKVLDFGISKSMVMADGTTPELNLTQTQTVLGSPQYMAPEQMRSSKRVDGRTDIWALGTTLFELLTGNPPFDAKTMPEVFAMILQDPAPPLAASRPNLPPLLESVVGRCLEKDPARRFADVRELAEALAPLASPVGAAVVGRIGRVGWNAGRASQPSFVDDASSAQSMNVARTDRDLGKTERTEAPLRARGYAAPLVAAALGALLLIGGYVGVTTLLRGRPTTTASMQTTAAPTSAPVAPTPKAEPAPPTSVAEPPPAVEAIPSVTVPSAPHAPMTPTKKAAPIASTARAPASASSASAPAPPKTSPHGVASSRYD